MAIKQEWKILTDRYLRGELSKEELVVLEKLCEQNSAFNDYFKTREHAVLEEGLEFLEGKAAFKKKLVELEKRKQLTPVDQKENKKIENSSDGSPLRHKSTTKIGFWLRSAAAAVLAFLFIWLVWDYIQKRNNTQKYVKEQDNIQRQDDIRLGLGAEKLIAELEIPVYIETIHHDNKTLTRKEKGIKMRLYEQEAEETRYVFNESQLIISSNIPQTLQVENMSIIERLQKGKTVYFLSDGQKDYLLVSDKQSHSFD